MYKALIDYALARQSWRRIVISHRESNVPSKRATLAHGFVYTHTEHKDDWPDGTAEDEVFYELDLVSLRNS